MSARLSLQQTTKKPTKMIDPSLYDLPGLEVGEPLDAVEITTTTLVGYHYKKEEQFPRPRGNCFSVEVPDHGEYRIVNFSYENIKEAVRRGVSWPIKILPIGRRVAVLHDARIPWDWYDSKWCETCCPDRLLPPPQRLLHLLEIERGVRVERDVVMLGGTVGRSVQYALGRPRLTLEDPDNQ
jgi:hypothetical protein